MLTVSLKLKKFYKYFECIEKIVGLEKSEIITPEVLQKIIKIFQYQQEVSERRRFVSAMKNRIDRLLSLLVKKMGQNPVLWKVIHEFNK